jgi:hypothetical protein
MTRKEYRAKKRAVRRAYQRANREALSVTRAEYIKAVQGFKRIVSRLPSVPLTGANEGRLKESIDRKELFDFQKGVIQKYGLVAMEKSSEIDAEYLSQAFEEARLGVSIEQIENIFKEQHERLLKRFQVANSLQGFKPTRNEKSFLLQNRASYTLSDSIWGGIDSFTDKILAYVQGSLEAGIDPAKIARGLEEYLKAGSAVVLGRWGSLVPGDSEYRKRLGKAGADYRTQRVVRTELYQMIRDNEVAHAKTNPALTGMFDWVLSPDHIDWDCDCPELAAGGPYTAEEAQGYSDSIHPNCRCVLDPVMKDDEAFMKSLEDYVSGEDTDGAREIEQWAARYGLSA